MKPMRLLAVEDNPRDLRLLQIALSECPDLGHTLESAASVPQAQARLRKDGVDLVLLDLNLPGSSGLETLALLQSAVPDGPPIVVLTGLADEDQGLGAVRRGAQDYLIKGRMTGDLLGRVLRYAVERHAILRELRRALARAGPAG